MIKIKIVLKKIEKKYFIQFTFFTNMFDLQIFTDNQLKAFQQAFNHYDKAQQGVIFIQEVPKALKNVGIIINSDDLTNISVSSAISLVNESDQVLDFPEFVSIIYFFLRASDTQEELIRAFSSFDTDHDGKIPTGLMSDILSNLKHPIPKEKADEFLQQFSDDNGLVDYKQFIKRVRP